MNDRTPTVWQIAAGETGRYYDDMFLKYDVMFMGPGNYGSFLENRDKYYRKASEGKGFTKHKANQIRSFCDDVRPGDIILVRKGYRVISLGLAADDVYLWKPSLDDVYGWDLQHCRRVIWQHQLHEEISHIQESDSNLFTRRKQIPTFTRVWDDSVLAPIRHLFFEMKIRELKAIFPETPKALSLDKIREELFNKGVAFESVDRVVSVIQHQRQLGYWYWEFGSNAGRPTEHEIVAHMVLPLFHALGWSEQLLAIEWRKIDLAAFSGAPTNAERCVLVCEAKSLWSGLQNVWDQAVNYVQQHHLIGCKKILITDGLRYFLYQQKGDEWKQSPDGYLNIKAIRTKHLSPPDTNAIDTMVALRPAGVEHPIGN